MKDVIDAQHLPSQTNQQHRRHDLSLVALNPNFFLDPWCIGHGMFRGISEGGHRDAGLLLCAEQRESLAC